MPKKEDAKEAQNETRRSGEGFPAWRPGSAGSVLIHRFARQVNFGKRDAVPCWSRGMRGRNLLSRRAIETWEKNAYAGDGSGGEACARKRRPAMGPHARRAAPLSAIRRKERRAASRKERRAS